MFDQDSTAEQVYDLCARNIINSAMEGRNGTIFCYGQTSSGKTHTMHGNPSCPGIVPRAISFIFDKIKNVISSSFPLPLFIPSMWQKQAQQQEHPLDGTLPPPSLLPPSSLFSSIQVFTMPSMSSLRIRPKTS